MQDRRNSTSAGAGHKYDQCHIGQNDQPAAEEPGPGFSTWPRSQKRDETPDDQHKMTYPPDRNRKRIRPLCMTRPREDQHLRQSGLKEMGNKYAKAIPGDGDDRAGAKSPWTVAHHKYKDRKVDQGLKDVKQPELWDDYRRKRQGNEEKQDAEKYQDAGPAGAGICSLIHFGYTFG
jgi:hypothetical protein